MHAAARVVGPMLGGKLPPPSAEEKKEKICREAGMCVHAGDGAIDGRMVGRFKTALKRSFPKSIPPDATFCSTVSSSPELLAHQLAKSSARSFCMSAT